MADSATVISKITHAGGPFQWSARPKSETAPARGVVRPRRNEELRFNEKAEVAIGLRRCGRPAQLRHDCRPVFQSVQHRLRFPGLSGSGRSLGQRLQQFARFGGADFSQNPHDAQGP